MIGRCYHKTLTRQAAGAWHVGDYDAASNTLRNRSAWSSVGGARLGSSATPDNAASPIRLGYAGIPYWRTFGNGDFDTRVVAPSRPVDLRNGFRVEARVATVSAMVGSGPFALVARIDNFGQHMQLGWRDGTIRVLVGLTTLFVVSTTNADEWMWRAWEVMPFTSGSGDITANFYGSADGVTWTLIGSNTQAAPSYSSSTLPFGWGNNSTRLAALSAMQSVVRYYEGGALIHEWKAADCGQTGYTDPVTNTVWTIHRASSGRKGVLVKAPMLLYGTDRYAEVADHADLNFGAGEPFTAASLVRRFGTVASGNQFILRKNIFPNARWGISWSSAANVSVNTSDGTNTSTANVAQVVNQADLHYQVRGGGLNTAGRGTTTASVVDTAGSLTNTDKIWIGRDGGGSGTGFADMEQRAAYVFRRALTTSELARLKWEADNYARVQPTN